LLPAWPSPSYPADAVREASRKDTFDLAPYRAGGQGYRILAMTPPVMAWRDSTIARTKAYWDSPFQLNKYPYELMDPIQAWSGFRPTISERRPVIVLSVVPDGVPELRYKRFPGTGRREVGQGRHPVGAVDSRRSADRGTGLGAVRRRGESEGLPGQKASRS
jgi:hypothetical protein